jgi:hypothetical protein
MGIIYLLIVVIIIIVLLKFLFNVFMIGPMAYDHQEIVQLYHQLTPLIRS